MKHQLSLEVPDTYNCKILRVIDTSKYVEELPVTCEYLQITGPGYLSPVQIEVEPKFSLILTACSLGIQTEECGDIQYAIPDGLYNIILSVSPNDLVRVEYNYLRVTEVMNSYFNELARIEVKGCPTEDCMSKRLKDLREIKSYIDVAKAKVEYYNQTDEGLDMLKYANKKLSLYINNCCK